MGSLSLRYFILGLWLESVYEIGELDRVLNEEDGNVVANDIPVAFICVELDCEPSNGADSVLPGDEYHTSF